MKISQSGKNTNARLSKKFLSMALVLTLLVTTVFTAFAVFTNDGIKANAADIGRTINVGTVEQIYAAFKDALPGDTIIIEPGTYTGVNGSGSKQSGNGSYFFWIGSKSGTADNHITVKAKDPSNPPILQGSRVGLTAFELSDCQYIDFENIIMKTGQKGLMIDRSFDCTFKDCEVYNTGDEAVHIRDGSKRITLDGLYIHDSGISQPSYGEGLYIGSDVGKWLSTGAGTLDENVSDIIVKNCTFSNTAAENIDIKEGSSNHSILNNTFNAGGITGANSSNRFITAKGDNTLIEGNVFNRENNALIQDAVQIQRITGAESWGQNVTIRNNTFVMDSDTEGYIVFANAKEVFVQNNTRIPEGNMYRTANGGIITVLTGTPSPTPTATLTPSPTVTPTPTPLGKGHILGNPTISVNDLLQLLRFIAGKVELTAEQLDAGNITGATGAKPGINDVLELIRYLAGKPNKLSQPT